MFRVRGYGILFEIIKKVEFTFLFRPVEDKNGAERLSPKQR